MVDEPVLSLPRVFSNNDDPADFLSAIERKLPTPS
jgi:hypothetical protein